MARVNNLTNFLTDVATAIKEKKGDNTAIPAASFDTEILNLPSQGVYQTKSITITSNGSQTVIPDQDFDAIEELVITTNVPIKQLQTVAYTFTQNTVTTLTPEIGYDGFESVNLTINVPTSEPVLQVKELNVTSNQTLNITPDQGYDGLERVKVGIHVEGGGGDDPAVNAVLWNILGFDQMVFNVLAEVLVMQAQFAGVGGTDEELYEVLDEILEGGSV